MSHKSKKLLIIGAGPTGLAAAVYAQRQGHQVTLLEKSSIAGGKGGSRIRGDFVVDFGPHAFHPSTKAITQLVEEHGDGKLFPVNIRQTLYITDVPMNYPFSLKEAFLKLNFFLNLRILLDYLFVKLKSIFVPLPKSTFKQWGIANFGHTLYDLCFGKFSERVWGCSGDSISVEFAKRKLPNFSLGEVLLELIFKKKKTKTSYHGNLGFVYHKKGIGRVYQNMADRIEQQGGRVLYNTEIENIELSADGTTVTSLTLNKPNHERLDCDYLVSSLPIADLIHYLSPKTTEFRRLETTMQYRHGLIINVILNRAQFADCHWAYLVNERFQFNRVSEQKNLSAECAPANQTLIAFERMCKPEDKEWAWNASEWMGPVLQELSFFDVKREDIHEIFVDKVEKAYPFFYVGYEPKKLECLQELGKINNLISTGRYGLSLDIDMHDSMLLGKEGLEYLLSNRVQEFYRNHEEICKTRDQ
jgi:protoporphyrinogen oxidase